MGLMCRAKFKSTSCSFKAAAVNILYPTCITSCTSGHPHVPGFSLVVSLPLGGDAKVHSSAFRHDQKPTDIQMFCC